DLNRLTTSEAEILELVAAGLTNAKIAERLWVSPGTVKKHLENIYTKLGVANRTAAVMSISLEPRDRAGAQRESATEPRSSIRTAKRNGRPS
ncbi:MAG: response regulator transcription factor, partial [Solirubrobacteraceae bacterium]